LPIIWSRTAATSSLRETEQFRRHIRDPGLRAEEGKVLTSSSRKTSEICQVISRTACQHHRLAGLSSTHQSEAFAWKGRPGIDFPQMQEFYLSKPDTK
jgi:hypothetical protein